MAKKKYVKPVMTSEAFVTDSYCAVCETITGYELVAQCGNCDPIKFIVSGISATNESGTILRNDATAHKLNGNQVGSGELVNVLGTNNWIFQGSIDDGCHTYEQKEDANYVGGEYILSSLYHDELHLTPCSCQGITNTIHHHLTEKSFTLNKNHS